MGHSHTDRTIDPETASAYRTTSDAGYRRYGVVCAIPVRRSTMQTAEDERETSTGRARAELVDRHHLSRCIAAKLPRCNCLTPHLSAASSAPPSAGVPSSALIIGCSASARRTRSASGDAETSGASPTTTRSRCRCTAHHRLHSAQPDPPPRSSTPCDLSCPSSTHSSTTQTLPTFCAPHAPPPSPCCLATPSPATCSSRRPSPPCIVCAICVRRTSCTSPSSLYPVHSSTSPSTLPPLTCRPFPPPSLSSSSAPHHIPGRGQRCAAAAALGCVHSGDR